MNHWIKELLGGLERWLSGSECPLFQETSVQFSASTSGGPQLSVSPTSGSPSVSGLLRYSTHRHTDNSN